MIVKIIKILAQTLRLTIFSVSSDPEIPADADSDYYILDEEPQFSNLPLILPSSSSSNVTVSRGGRAHLHCTIQHALRRTVRNFKFQRVLVDKTVSKVSWVRLRNLSNPSLISVGQCLFNQDQRFIVASSPAIQRWSLTINVS